MINMLIICLRRGELVQQRREISLRRSCPLESSLAVQACELAISASARQDERPQLGEHGSRPSQLGAQLVELGSRPSEIGLRQIKLILR
jgi:hypothetical protein